MSTFNDDSEFTIDDLDELGDLAEATSTPAFIDPTIAPWLGAWRPPSTLPEWYMPAPIALRVSTSRRLVVSGVIAGFVLIDLCGLCITSGFLTWA